MVPKQKQNKLSGDCTSGPCVAVTDPFPVSDPLTERRKKASAWERNLVYPAVMVLLLIETVSLSASATWSASAQGCGGALTAALEREAAGPLLGATGE